MAKIPYHRTPCGSEAQNEETGEAYHCNSRRRCIGRIDSVKREMSDRRKDHEAHKHPNAACNERLSATVMLDKVEADKSGSKVDTIEDHLSNE